MTPPADLFGPAVLGTMTMGDTVDAAGAARMLEIAAAAGVTMVDTANGYAGGATERLLADLLPRIAPHARVATKAGMPHPDAGSHSPLSRDGLRSALEGSLGRLRRDSVDLFYLHQPDRAVPVEETLSTLGEFLAEGRVGAWGVSNYSAWEIARLQSTADALGLPRPVVAQQLYNLVARRLEDEYVGFAGASGIRTMVYNPLGGGLLTGRHRFDAPPEDGRFATSRLAEMYTDRYWDAGIFAAIQAYGRIAEEAGMSLIELSLRWLRSAPVVDAVLVGGSRPEQISANLDFLARGPLPDDIVDACARVGLDLRGPMPAYHR